MSESSPTSKLEKNLYHLYQSSQPDAEFVISLKNKLVIESETDISKRPILRASISRLFLRPAWVVVLLLIVALVSTLLIIGPQRVLAEFERLLGYLPGIGFVDLDSARVLSAPVQQQQGNVILQVDQVLASPKKTILSLSTQGFDNNNLPYPNPAVNDYFEASVLLPDGQSLSLLSWQLEVGNARLEFPPIPANVEQITLELPRLPLAPEGAAPQNWRVALTLRPASGDLPPDMFPPAYDPQVSPVTKNGITLQVLQVAQDAKETAILARLSWENISWEYVTWYDPLLKDNLGHIYWQASNPSNAGLVVISAPADQAATPSAQSSEHTFRMAPLSLAASQATLSLGLVDVQIPVDAGFHFDPGQDVQVGQTWEMDETIDAGRYKLHLVRARFLKDQSQQDGDQPAYRLEFSIEMPDLPDSKVDGLWLDTRSPGFDGSGGGMDASSYTAYLTTDQVPNAPIDVRINEVSVQFNGPWDITWNLPQTNETSTGGMRTLHPEVPQTHNGLSLNVDKALLSDRISVFYLSASGLPQDGQLTSLYGLTPGGVYSKNRLFDQWNQEIGFPQDVTWTPMGEPDYDPARLLFAPLPPLTQSMRLEIPAVEVSVPADASLDFVVPPNMALHPEEYPVQVIGGGGPERTVMQTHWVSDYWSTDFPFQVGDFSLQFEQARLVQEPNSPVQLIIEGRQISNPADNSLLTQLQFASLAWPDGQYKEYTQPEDGGFTMSAVGLADWDGSHKKDVFALIFLVGDPNTNDVISGAYHAEINGMIISVPGPWMFNMDLH